MKKNKLFAIMLVILVLLFAACSRSAPSDVAEGMRPVTTTPAMHDLVGRSASEVVPFGGSAEVPFAQGAISPATTAPGTSPGTDDRTGNFHQTYADTAAAQRMIIRASNLGLNTYYFSDTVDGVHQIVANRGGFVESSRQWMVEAPHDSSLLLWRAEFVLRVPVGLFDRVNNELVDLAQVTRFSTTSEDVTMEFHDLTSRSRIREEELRRTELMLEAATNLNDILRLESQLTSLRLAVDAYQRRLTEIDQLSSFSTIRLALYEMAVIPEPEEYEEEDEEEYIPIIIEDGFGTQFLAAFSASWNFVVSIFTSIALFVALVGLPVLIFAVLGFVVYTILKRWGLKIRFKI